MCKIYIILSLNKPNPKAESIERERERERDITKHCTLLFPLSKVVKQCPYTRQKVVNSNLSAY